MTISEKKDLIILILAICSAFFLVYSSIILYFKVNSKVRGYEDKLSYNKLGKIYIILAIIVLIVISFLYFFSSDKEQVIKGYTDLSIKCLFIFIPVTLILQTIYISKLSIQIDANAKLLYEFDNHNVKKDKTYTEHSYSSFDKYGNELEKQKAKAYYFDKYGLSLTRTGNETHEYQYGIIDRFGNHILENNYLFYGREIKYFKFHKLIIVENIDRRQGVIDIYGNWIVELGIQEIMFPSKDAYFTETKYIDTLSGMQLSFEDIILVVLEEKVKDETQIGEGWWTNHREDKGYILTSNYQRIKLNRIKNHWS